VGTTRPGQKVRAGHCVQRNKKEKGGKRIPILGGWGNTRPWTGWLKRVLLGKAIVWKTRAKWPQMKTSQRGGGGEYFFWFIEFFLRQKEKDSGPVRKREGEKWGEGPRGRDVKDGLGCWRTERGGARTDNRRVRRKMTFEE